MASPSSNNYNSQLQQPLLQQPAPQVVVLQTERPVEKSSSPVLKTLYTVFHLVVSVFAIFLSFQCNTGVGKSFDVLSFLAALFFPYIYILYIFVTRPDFCNVKGTVSRLL